LMMALLEDALRCFQNNADAANGRRQRLFAEAERWLWGEEGDSSVSFKTVCETLGIEPGFLRKGLKDWRDQQLACISTWSLTRRSPVIRSGRLSAPARRRKRASTTASPQ
jgi:hypothetical protein